MPVTAGGLSYGKMIAHVGSMTNDGFGDLGDRWQTGSYQQSFFFADGDQGIDQVLEYRLRAQVVSPWYDSYLFDDLPYANSLAIGAVWHAEMALFDTKFGGEFIITGDQTGLDHVQYTIHDIGGFDNAYDPRTRKDQRLGDDFHLKFEGEASGDIQITDYAMARPYVSAEMGAETGIRIGTDFIFGSMANDDSQFWTRDIVTGQVLSTNMHRPGISLIAGVDFGHVESTYLIPQGADVEAEHARVRGRLGVQGGIGPVSVFFGQSWLSEEYVGQPDTQRIGPLSVRFGF